MENNYYHATSSNLSFNMQISISLNKIMLMWWLYLLVKAKYVFLLIKELPKLLERC